MKNKIILEQSPREVLNIIEALSFYRDNSVKPGFKNIIDKQLDNINIQLNSQNIDIYMKYNEPEFKLGQITYFDDKQVIIVGISNDDGFIKIAMFDNDQIKILEVPFVLLKNRR